MSKEDIETMKTLQELENSLNQLANRCVEMRKETATAIAVERLKQPIVFMFMKSLKENEANKKRINELEEENKIYRRQLNSAFDRGFIHKDKIINLLKTKIIEYDCEDCITGKFIEVKDIEELLKDKGE